MKERIHWIDISKGIAILCVFIGHTISTPKIFSDFVYYFHMPLFFFMSGYCFSAKRNTKDFIVNKLKTVVLPIFTLGFTGSVIVAVLMNFLKHEEIQWKWIFLNPVIQYKEHCLLWFLASLFVALTVFYFIVRIFKDKLVPIAITSILLSVSTLVLIKTTSIFLPWNIQTSLVSLMFISVGYIIKKTSFYKKLNHIWVLVATAFACIIFGYLNDNFFESVEMHSNDYGNPLLFYLSALAGCLMVMSFSILIEKNSVLEYFGKNSLIFYALEPIQYFANFAIKTVNHHISFSSASWFSIIETTFAIASICLLSCVAAKIINFYLPFLIGKKHSKIELK
ncbi:MAG: acyltransferase family protein [Clostridia bacterium]|nr:acyltransferase family protein [Clostridia bacterium]